MTPGTGFGAAGEGFFRVSLVADERILQEAIDKLRDGGVRFR